MAKVASAPHLKVEKHDAEDDVIGIVQGIIPDSKNEWFVSLALDKLEIDYMFQVSIGGGRGTRGGQVIDFLVFIPKATPVFVQGAYWHSGKTENEDILKQAFAEAYYNVKPILLAENETDTKEKALQVVRERIK